MKYKVERCIECESASWLVMGDTGLVVGEYSEWEVAIEDAILRYRHDLLRPVRARIV